MDSYLFQGQKTSLLDSASITPTFLRKQNVSYCSKHNNSSYLSFSTFLNTPSREIYHTMDVYAGFSTVLPIALSI